MINSNFYSLIQHRVLNQHSLIRPLSLLEDCSFVLYKQDAKTNKSHICSPSLIMLLEFFDIPTAPHFVFRSVARPYQNIFFTNLFNDPFFNSSLQSNLHRSNIRQYHHSTYIPHIFIFIKRLVSNNEQTLFTENMKFFTLCHWNNSFKIYISGIFLCHFF